MAAESESFRDQTDSAYRAIEFTHTIDPGFVNRRLLRTVIGAKATDFLDQQISRTTAMPGGLYDVQVDHIHCRIALEFCNAVNVKTLGEVLASGDGRLFCSTERLLPCPDIYDKPRVESKIALPENTDMSVVLEYSTQHIGSDTLKMELDRGDEISVIAKFDRKAGNTLYFQPIVMGGPWLAHEDEDVAAWAMWQCQEHFEHFVDDFDEFTAISSIEKPTNVEPMRQVSENAFKQCLARILGDTTKKDWGGEMSDHFTSQLHLQGKRVTGAFLLKGPAKFTPMTPSHLGKNSDQIFRLAQEPADVLFVQHCHEIETSVRAMLRAFAVQPGNPRRYCLIDGLDSLWLLRAYRLYDEAVSLTEARA